MNLIPERPFQVRYVVNAIEQEFSVAHRDFARDITLTEKLDAIAALQKEMERIFKGTVVRRDDLKRDEGGSLVEIQGNIDSVRYHAFFVDSRLFRVAVIARNFPETQTAEADRFFARFQAIK
jgi:hypothetical protein